MGGIDLRELILGDPKGLESLKATVPPVAKLYAVPGLSNLLLTGIDWTGSHLELSFTATASPALYRDPLLIAFREAGVISESVEQEVFRGRGYKTIALYDGLELTLFSSSRKKVSV